MKLVQLALAFAFALATSVPSHAQHIHAKGPNGGQMEDIAGIDAEFVASGNTLTFHLFDESAKPVSAKGFSGAVLVASNGGKETLTLVQSGESSMKAEAKAPIAAGTSVTLNLKSAEGKSGQAKFKK